MAKAISITQAEDKVRQTLNTLTQAHSKWNEQQRITDNMLYVLIEECVGFYRFVKSDERYETAFKNVCGYTFRHKTSLANVIAKCVFGKTKQTYAYGKAMMKAVAENIGDDGEISVLQWLSENGGVNGVIRNGESDTKAETEHLINVANNFAQYYVEKKLASVKVSDYLLNHKQLKDGDDIILVAKVKDGKAHISTFGTSNQSIVNAVYADVGKQITQTDEYKENAEAVTKALDEMNAEAIAEVGKKMDAIQQRMKAEEAKEEMKKAA